MEPKTPNLRIFGLEFEKIIVMFQISVLELVLLQKLKSLNLGPKMPYFGIIGLEFEKAVVIFEISTLNIV